MIRLMISTVDCIGVTGFIRKAGRYAIGATLYDNEDSVNECQVGTICQRNHKS